MIVTLSIRCQCGTENIFDVEDNSVAIKSCKKCGSRLEFMVHDIVNGQIAKEWLEKQVQLGRMTRTFENGQFQYQLTNQQTNPI
jgi:predicted nucleic-acid-binding Zn-ribbon protein